MCFRLHRGLCTRPCTGSNSRAGSAANGAKAKPAGTPSITPSPARAEHSSKRSWRSGSGCPTRSGSSSAWWRSDGMHLERWLDIMWLRLRSLLRRDAVERELDRELRFHLDQEIEKNVRLGMAPSAARSAALQRLGGVAQIQEECRDMRRSSFIESSIHDLGYAGRILRKAPAFTLAAIATLALGIGANTAIFQLLDTVRLRSLSVAEPHKLALIQIAGKGGSGIGGFGVSEHEDNLSYPLFQAIREHQGAFSGVFAWNSGYTRLSIGRGERAHRADVLGVTGDFFHTL